MRLTILSILLLFGAAAIAQQEKMAAKKGNAAYLEGNYEAATGHYEKSLDLKRDYFEGTFNMGNSLHRQAITIGGGAKEAADEATQKQLLEQSQALNKRAAAQFEMAAEQSEDKLTKAQAYHNMGNAHLLSGDIDASIDAYKKALRNNPTDEDTRYNLAFAQHMKKKQEQEQQKQDENKDEKKDENKDEKKDENKDQEKEKKDEQNEEGEQQDQQPQPNQLSKEDAQEMLNALEKEEKDVQDKVKLKKMKAVKSNIEKDW
jgi:Ca-activated chloride channel homolog